MGQAIGRVPAFAVMALIAVWAALAPLATGSAAAGHGKLKVRPEPPTILPSAAEGCDGATTTNGVTTIPVKVGHYVGGGVTVVVNVCFGGKGPFPLVLDTGAAITTLSTSLAKELGLAPVGAPGRIEGAGCKAAAQTYELPGWSVGGVPLEGGVVETTAAPESGRGHTRGSLGADVLSRFGAVRIDFRRETLTLVGPEGPEFERPVKTRTLPPGLVRAKPRIAAPMKVESVVGNVLQTVDVKIGSGGARPWLIDTGAELSVLNEREVRTARLRPTGEAEEGTTFCSKITVPEYASGPWKLDGNPLKPGPLGAISLGGGSEGLVGASTLARYGSVVFDWAGGRLLLGAG